VHTGQPNTTEPQLLSEMQQMLNHWDGGLNATSGALVPYKSYWYGIAFKWHPTKLKWMYKTIAEMPGEMTIKDHLRNDAILHRLIGTEARETLGLWITMDGNQPQQVLALIAKVLAWADKSRTKHLTKTEAWLSLRMGILKALQYPLAATSLSKKQCKLIDKKLLKAALLALGFPSSFPQVIAQAPPKVLLSLGIPALWNQQGIEHVAALLRHGDIPANNVTGCLLGDVMATLRLELGLPGAPLRTLLPTVSTMYHADLLTHSMEIL
jgi:hypothetical protein